MRAGGRGVAALLGQGAGSLRAAGQESAPATARLLLCHVLEVDPTGLILAAPPTDEQVGRYCDLVAACAAGRPAQYLIGEAWFRGVRLAVGPGVFIPRPETELVVGAALEACRSAAVSDRRPVVVDLCTGSGAMAAALAGELPEARVHAVEADPHALEWAARNLSGTGVSLHAGDARRLPEGVAGQADVVMTNPPYLPLALSDQVAAQVIDNEPTAALFSGADGLDLMRDLVPHAATLLRPGGSLVIEHDPSQHESLPELLVRDGRWCRICDHDDLTGRARFVTACRSA